MTRRSADSASAGAPDGKVLGAVTDPTGRLKARPPGGSAVGPIIEATTHRRERAMGNIP